MKDLTAETHTTLDAEFLESFPGAGGELLILYLVLSQSAPSYAAVDWSLRTFNVAACSEILRDQGVLDLVRQAREKGQYAEIRKLREWQFMRSKYLIISHQRNFMWKSLQ